MNKQNDESDFSGLKRDLVLENLSECKSTLHFRAKSGKNALNFSLAAGKYRISGARVIFALDSESSALLAWVGKKIAALFFYKHVALSFSSILKLSGEQFSLSVSDRFSRVPRKKSESNAVATVFSVSEKKIFTAEHRGRSELFSRDWKSGAKNFLASEKKSVQTELLFASESGFALSGTGDFPFSFGEEYSVCILFRISGKKFRRKIQSKCRADKKMCVENAWCAHFSFCGLKAEDERFLSEKAEKKSLFNPRP